MVYSIGTPSGHHASTCGYCSPPGRRSSDDSFRSAAGLSAMQLSCEVYQKMIDRGWRRSGKWCYKPHLRASCCPLYTIKLDATLFKPSKSHKKLLNRWNRFIIGDETEADDIEHKRPTAKKQKGKNNAEFNLKASIHASENELDANRNFAHRFEMVLEPSSYSDEKFELFKKYQREIHDDESSPQGFRRFLVDSPLHPEQIPYPTPPPKDLPTHYGSYHWCYRLDGKLIAVAVIDILPYCVSSVYFMYDNDYEEFSLGKLSALREIILTCELQAAGAPTLKYLYLGYYIHSCPKMSYKGDYQPSYLCDPESFAWFPFTECTQLLSGNRYACFSTPEHSIQGPPDSEIVRQFDEYVPRDLENDTLENVLLIQSVRRTQLSVVPVNASRYWDIPDFRKEILCCVEELGPELAKSIVFKL